MPEVGEGREAAVAGGERRALFRFHAPERGGHHYATLREHASGPSRFTLELRRGLVWGFSEVVFSIGVRESPGGGYALVTLDAGGGAGSEGDDRILDLADFGRAALVLAAARLGVSLGSFEAATHLDLGESGTLGVDAAVRERSAALLAAARSVTPRSQARDVATPASPTRAPATAAAPTLAAPTAAAATGVAATGVAATGGAATRAVSTTVEPTPGALASDAATAAAPPAAPTPAAPTPDAVTPDAVTPVGTTPVATTPVAPVPGEPTPAAANRGPSEADVHPESAGNAPAATASQSVEPTAAASGRPASVPETSTGSAAEVAAAGPAQGLFGRLMSWIRRAARVFGGRAGR